MKSGFFAALALSGAVAGLAGCGQEQPAAPAGPQAPAGIAVANAWLALPPVKGNPGAVYFDITNRGSDEVAFRSAEVEGAQSAMMHVSVDGSMNDLMLQPVKPGETVKFAPGGSHVMAMGLADTLKPGGKTKVTLHFSRGETLTFPADILAAGDAR
jgi:copper(I)-binding protein